MRVGLLSDTHGFEAILELFADRDEIWHAGDFGTAEVLDRLRAIKPVRGVYGNIDGPEIRERTPADLDWSVDGLHVYMIHIGGYPGRYDPDARRELERRKPGLFICGHSHIVRVMRDERLGLVHLNPGAAGHSGWHLRRTAMRFEIMAGQVSNIELARLGETRQGPILPVGLPSVLRSRLRAGTSNRAHVSARFPLRAARRPPIVPARRQAAMVMLKSPLIGLNERSRGICDAWRRPFSQLLRNLVARRKRIRPTS